MKTGKKKNRKINVINLVEKLKKKIKNIIERNFNSKNKFWQFVKPFLTNKRVFGTDFISIKKDNQFVNNEIELVEIFNYHYINIVGNMTGSLQILASFMIYKKITFTV